jgi:hypothetical protein
VTVKAALEDGPPDAFRDVGEKLAVVPQFGVVIVPV